MPVILTIPEAEISRIAVRSQPGQIVHKSLFQKAFTKIGLVKWLKLKVLSSSSSTEKKQNSIAS
jgi:hypothetical protein